MDYKARFYSPALGRFIQPDSIIPGAANPQSWNRFSYVTNNPIGYTDPTGHRPDDGCRNDGGCSITSQTISDDYKRDKDFKDTTARNKCKAGNKIHCSFAQNHPIQTALFIPTALIGGAALEGFILEGGAAATTTAVYNVVLKPALMPVYAWLSQFFTKNPNSQTVSIGSFDKLGQSGYIEKGIEKGYTYFSMNPTVYNVLNKVGQAKPINEGFMVNQMNQSKDFVLTVLNSKIGESTVMEIGMLAANGYARMQGAINAFLHPTIQ